MTVHQQLDVALRRLEATMKASNLWRMPRPAPEASESREPFCVDTMSLPEWLRFVFIARLDALVDAQAPLPASCSVAPAAELYLKQTDIRASDLLLMVKAIEEVDRVVTEG
ncbi:MULTISPECIES: YqcC family protein [Halomonadaceae]|uniref:YqcC family protein n=1 Tax=Halomonadaceae TaxID=28256 RepID=UPI00159A07CB|nr:MULTISPECIES: YqcC family protein [Halomonas]QJQ95293.1 YqcC family protein [Halomonas sp. PA5]